MHEIPAAVVRLTKPLRRACPILLAWLALSGAVRAAEVAPLPAEQIPRFTGTAHQVGLAQGQRYRAEIHAMVDEVVHAHLPRWYHRAFARFAVWRMGDHIAPEIREELRGIAAGAGVEERDILNGNLIPDINALSGNPFACSSVAVLPGRSATGAMLVGRNLDWYHLLAAYMRQNLRPMIVARDGTLPILVIGYPGMAGVLTGVNARGVFVSLNYSSHEDETGAGVPVTFLVRRVLEQATSADHARRLIGELKPRTIAVNLLVADGSQALVMETTAHREAALAPHQGVVYAANHFESPALRGVLEEERDYRWPVLTRLDAAPGPVSLDQLQTLVGDAAMSDPKWRNVQAVLVDYGRAALRFGADGERAGHGALQEIDLRAALGLEPAPPAGAAIE